MAELTQMKIVSVEELENQLGVNKWPHYVKSCEEMFQKRISEIAMCILRLNEVKAVFVSGPTASGKTTFSDRLAKVLTSRGRRTRIISLDDYYQTINIDYDMNGRPDFESIHTLDTHQIVLDFQTLLKGYEVHIPTFDFVNRCRVYEDHKKLRLHDSDLVLIEGLHGLSELVAGHFSHQQYFGVFIMPWCSLLDGRQLLGSRDLRMLRRMSRDALHRGSTALSTLDYWPMIDHTEQVFFPQYLAKADTYINSALPYEFSIIAPLAATLLEQSLQQYEKGTLPGSIYRKDMDGYADLESAIEEARNLLQACSRIPQTDKRIVPPESILNEFIH